MSLRVPSHPDLKRIVVLNPKGGSGKSTIATNLAGFLSASGHPCAIMDFDPQGSSTRWLHNRPDMSPEIYGIAAYDIDPTKTRSFQLQVPQRFRYLVVDTPAALSASDLADFTVGAHAIVVPVLPSDIDIHAAAGLLKDLLVVAKVSRRMGRLGIVANRVRENTLGYRKLKRFIDYLSITFIGELRDSQNYIHAAEQGISIHEMLPSKVRKDIDSWQPLLEWLEERLEKSLTPRDWFGPDGAVREDENQASPEADAQLPADDKIIPFARKSPEEPRTPDSGQSSPGKRRDPAE